VGLRVDWDVGCPQKDGHSQQSFITVKIHPYILEVLFKVKSDGREGSPQS
jgi:hypothetical protein